MSSLLRNITIIFLLVSLSSYQFNSIDNCNQLTGVWVYSNYDDQGVTYIKSKSFEDDLSGFKFKKRGKLKNRINVSSRSTEPITYGNYNGCWAITANNTLYISFEFWGGVHDEELEIVELTNDTLVLRKISDQNKD